MQEEHHAIDKDIYFGKNLLPRIPDYIRKRGLGTKCVLVADDTTYRVAGAVVTQEYIDGNQDEYLMRVRAANPVRIRVSALYEERPMGDVSWADGDAQVASLREMIQQHPDVRMAIGQFGMVPRSDWREQIKLARHKNVFVESGGITLLFNSEFYPYPSAVRVIREAADICGMEKLMWGSDYPRTMTAITYRMNWDFVDKSPLLSAAESGCSSIRMRKSSTASITCPRCPMCIT